MTASQSNTLPGHLTYAPDATHTYSILIVDDDVTTARLIESYLQAEGFQTLVAVTSQQALAMATHAHPHLILLDVQLPDDDGFTTCLRLKAHAQTRDIPVIFVTSSTESADRIHGLTIGGVDFISKPFVRNELIARINIHLRLAGYAHLLADAQLARLDQLRATQTAMLVRPEEVPEAHIAVWYHPLHAVGGDFYDVTPHSHDQYGYLLADISGHDIDVAFFTSALKALFRQNCTPLHTPLELMHLLNNVLLVILQPEQYITACYVQVNRRRMQMKIVSAGHPPLLLVRPGHPARWLDGGGDVLGAFPDATFASEEVAVAPGDRCLLYSDGLLDIDIPSHPPYSDGKAMLLGESEHLALRPLPCMVRELSLIFLPAAEAQRDDQVLLGIEV